MCGIQDCQKSEFVQNVNQPIGIEKKCSRCGKTKPVSEFHKNGKYIRSFCKKCHNLSVKKWKAKNQTKVKDYNTKNADKRAEYMKQWRAENPDKVKKQAAKWVSENRARWCKKKVIWNNENPVKVKDYHHQRRARIRGTTFEKINADQVYERDGWICKICGEIVNQDLEYPDPLSKTLDHIIPLSKGGSHTVENVQLAHLNCNLKKYNKLERSFQPSLALAL